MRKLSNDELYLSAALMLLIGVLSTLFGIWLAKTAGVCQ